MSATKDYLMFLEEKGIVDNVYSSELIKEFKEKQANVR